MTRFFKYTGVISLMAIILVSCTPEDINNVDPDVSNNVQTGKWAITLYSDGGQDELYHFSGYEFSFQNGTATAVKGGDTISGTYSNGIDDSEMKFYLDFGNLAPFDELNDDWHILENTTTKIRLEDVSGGNGDTDLLTFERK